MSSAGFTILRCATAGVEAVSASSRHSFSRHTHEQFGIGAIHWGAHRSHSGRGQVEAGAGDTITVNPGEVHDGAPIGEAGRAWRMLYLDPEIVQVAAREVFADGGGEFEFTRPVIGERRVGSLFARLFAAETGLDSEVIRREELLLALIASAGGYRPGRRQEVSAPVASAKTRIDDDPAAPVTLAELATIAGISRFSLLRGFARLTGLTPHAYVVQQRTNVARRLIARGETLANTAAAAGFADQSHMTRTFVRRYGISPGAYAKAMK